jgi:hypothetical protein
MESKLKSLCPSDATTCSAFWSCVAGSVAIITETLPRCGSSSLFHESKSMREALARLVGIMERGEAIEIRKAETLEEMEARRMTEHVCAMHRDMMGKCFVCGSSCLHNAERIRAEIIP